MGLDVYFRRDIANVLRATACASEGSMSTAVQLLGDTGIVGAHGMDVEQTVQIYRQGVRNTLLSVGLAFGLEPIVQRKPGVTPGLAGLLWAETPHDRWEGKE